MFTPICVLLTECVEHIEAVRNKLVLDDIPAINKNIVASDIAHKEITLPLSIALNTALQQRTCTAILDAQGINFEATMLLLSHASGIPLGVLMSGTLLDDDWDKLVAALEPLNDAELYFMSNEPAPMERLIRHLNGLKISKKLGLIVVNGLKIEDENQIDALLNKKNYMEQLCRFSADSNISILIANQV
jgi:replicative DNA helicase